MRPGRDIDKELRLESSIPMCPRTLKSLNQRPRGNSSIRSLKPHKPETHKRDLHRPDLGMVGGSGNPKFPRLVT